MSPKPKRQLADEKVLTVYLGGDAFGIPIAQIQSVLESLPLTHVPLAPAAVKAVLSRLLICAHGSTSWTADRRA